MPRNFAKDLKMVALNKSTQILIDNFINTNFANIPSENRAKIKESVIEIADSILEQSNKDLDKLATKGDLKDEVTLLRNDISKLEVRIAENKADIIRWLLTAQFAIAGILIAMIKFGAGS